jgi:hypothetical protein
LLNNFNRFSIGSKNIYKNKFKIVFFYRNLFNVSNKINYNLFNFFNKNFKKNYFFNKNYFVKTLIKNKNTIFYKNITKLNNLYKKQYLYFIYSNRDYLNSLIKFNFFYIIFNIFKKQFFLKNYFIYKNIFKNIYLLKNVNSFIFNKNYFLFNNNLLNFFKINFFNFKKLNFIYNNQFPLIFFKKFNKFIFDKFNLKKKNNYVSIFNNYILNFLEFFFKKNFFIKISNKINLNSQKKILFFSQNFNNNVKFQKFIDLNEIVELFCIVFIYKDLILFKN